ncbi:MAG: phospholipid-binding domain-containing protein [Micavibrio aeruginosavorus]|uniref:Phospholipid-binding domain-containing protein n=1 Tax=Micavibrio aeruginosavorus TaxID=349221 RepID=A0A2W5N5Z5_9BACT|nr:MAG: phospholipid-binding domain-containing protein [Micavibrio aeruginosavorus]
MRVFTLLLIAGVSMSAISACTPLGMASGAAAGVGNAASKEGGLSGAVTDASIKGQINESWFQYNIETFSKLSTTVNQGRVLLTGVVQNPQDRVEAVRLVWQVQGVKQVINEIRVADSEGLPGFVKDNWITTRLRTAITFEKNVQSLNYSIDTVQGVVYLMGVAMNQHELDTVISLARTIPNVKQVVSYVKMIGEPVQATGIQQ